MRLRLALPLSVPCRSRLLCAVRLCATSPTGRRRAQRVRWQRHQPLAAASPPKVRRSKAPLGPLGIAQASRRWRTTCKTTRQGAQSIVEHQLSVPYAARTAPRRRECWHVRSCSLSPSTFCTLLSSPDLHQVRRLPAPTLHTHPAKSSSSLAARFVSQLESPRVGGALPQGLRAGTDLAPLNNTQARVGITDPAVHPSRATQTRPRTCIVQTRLRRRHLGQLVQTPQRRRIRRLAFPNSRGGKRACPAT